LWQVTAKSEGPGGAGAIAGALPGKAFVDREKNFPETRGGFAHGAMPLRRVALRAQQRGQRAAVMTLSPGRPGGLSSEFPDRSPLYAKPRRTH
jgi:hypothetical protein